MLIQGCQKADPVPVSATGLFFDTVVNITLYEYPGSSQKLLEGCLDTCRQDEELFSPNVEGSDIYRINHAAQDADGTAPASASVSDRFKAASTRNPDGSVTVSVHRETADLISTALSYCEMSDGQLDLTIGGLCDLWDIRGNSASETPVIPDGASIAKALGTADYRNISVKYNDDNTCSVTLKNPDTRITLGFIAKGYTADRIEDYLRDNGVTGALINLGGNVKTIGEKSKGKPFKVGIQKPFAAQGEIQVTADAKDLAVVSSGTYERYFSLEGRIYHHILSTRDGYPVDNGVAGVTVSAPEATDADALSTLCLILGKDAGIDLIESIDDTEVFYIMADGTTGASDGFPFSE